MKIANHINVFTCPVLCAGLVVASLLTFPTALRAQEKAASKNTVNVPATVAAYQSADLYSRVGGYIKEVSVDIGDTVEKGQVLAAVDVPEIEKQLLQKESVVRQAEAQELQSKAKVDEAVARLEAYKASVAEAKTACETKQAMSDFQRTEYNRLNDLAGRGAVQRELVDAATYQFQAPVAEIKSTTAKVATAEANLVGAQAAVRRAEADTVAAASNVDVAKADRDYVNQMLEFSKIRAPFAGQVTMRAFDQGAFVQSADGNSAAKPLFHLVRSDKVRVRFAISMGDIAKLNRGDKVTLSRIDGMKERKFEGTVTRFSAGLDKQTRMLRAEMDLDNADGALRPGFFGYVTVELE